MPLSSTIIQRTKDHKRCYNAYVVWEIYKQKSRNMESTPYGSKKSAVLFLYVIVTNSATSRIETTITGIWLLLSRLETPA
ncbi:MAG: hypothetical protein ACLTD2_05590 [Ruminococcus sp.]